MSRPDLLSGQQCAELRATILGGHPRAAEHLDALIDDRQRLAARSPAPRNEDSTMGMQVDMATPAPHVSDIDRDQLLAMIDEMEEIGGSCATDWAMRIREIALGGQTFESWQATLPRKTAPTSQGRLGVSSERGPLVLDDSPAPIDEPWRCRHQRSHGTCNGLNDADEETCGACGEDRPPAAPILEEREAPEPFVVRFYTDDDRPSIKGNGFDGLRVGTDREEAEEFVAWLNARLRPAIQEKTKTDEK